MADAIKTVDIRRPNLSIEDIPVFERAEGALPAEFKASSTALIVPLPALTSLRFFGAAVAVYFHTVRDIFINKDHDNFIFSLAMQQAVSFFFVLSGFVLYYRYRRLENKESVVKFFAARFARIWPAHIVSMILVVAFLPPVHWQAGDQTFWYIVTSASLVSSLIPFPKFSLGINPPSWSVSTEFIFYLLFPLILLSWESTWKKKLLLSLAVVCLWFAIAQCYGMSHPGQRSDYFLWWSVYINPLVRIFEFIVGITAGWWFCQVAKAKEWPGKLLSLHLLQIAALIAVGFSVWFCALPMQYGSDYGLPYPAAYWCLASGGAFVYAFLIFIMAFGRGVISKLLSFPLFVFVGEISYSIYLLHSMLFLLLIDHKVDFLGADRWLSYMEYWGILMVMSSICFVLIERPCRQKLPKLICRALRI